MLSKRVKGKLSFRTAKIVFVVMDVVMILTGFAIGFLFPLSSPFIGKNGIVTGFIYALFMSVLFMDRTFVELEKLSRSKR